MARTSAAKMKRYGDKGATLPHPSRQFEIVCTKTVVQDTALRISIKRRDPFFDAGSKVEQNIEGMLDKRPF